MNSNRINSNPALSICIPTFNRVNHLSKLLLDIEIILNRWPNEIEVCISNNCSDDGTNELLKNFSQYSNIQYKTQIRNIGAAKNIIEVCKNSKGKWILLVGDDDRIDINALGGLLSNLELAIDSTWIILESISGQKKIERKLPTICRVYTSQFPKLTALKFGATYLGFMGLHVIPREAVNSNLLLSAEDMNGFPYLAWFFNHAARNQKISKFSSPIIIQSAGELALFWPTKDIASIFYKFTLMSLNIYRKSKVSKGFLFLMTLRQLYSFHGFAFNISWKLKDPAEFNSNIFEINSNFYKELNNFRIFTAPHSFIIWSIKILPLKFFKIMLPSKVLKHMYELHQRETEMSCENNGVSRGF